MPFAVCISSLYLPLLNHLQMAFEVLVFDGDGADHFFRASADGLAGNLKMFYGLSAADTLCACESLSSMAIGEKLSLRGDLGQVIAVTAVDQLVISL